MANTKNIAIAASLKEKISKAKSVVLTDYRGLTHKQSEELHKNVKKAGGEFVVAKNSLLKIAGGWQLKDPTAILLAYEDELAPIKELFKTIKNLSIPKIKFGFIGTKQYSDIEIETIAKLPGREILQGQIVSRLSSPLYGLAYSLNYNLQKIVLILGKVEGLRAVNTK